jgi:hypothetical protein
MVEPVLAEYDPLAHKGPEPEPELEQHLGLLQFACGLLWFRRYDRLTAT